MSGETDAFAASEFPADRSYDRSWRSAAAAPPPRCPGCSNAGRGSPTDRDHGGRGHADRRPRQPTTVILEFADERSVVQTRFATTALAFLRAAAGQDLDRRDRRRASAVARRRPAVDATAFDHFVFLGHGWTVGLANEAALKMREAAQAHTESLSRHGVPTRADQRGGGPRPLVWVARRTPDRRGRRRRAGDRRLGHGGRCDPMAELILIQRAAVALADAKGLDPDRSPQPDPIRRAVVRRTQGVKGEMKRRALFVILTVMALVACRMLGQRGRHDRARGLGGDRRRTRHDHLVARLRQARRAERRAELRSRLDQSR